MSRRLPPSALPLECPIIDELNRFVHYPISVQLRTVGRPTQGTRTRAYKTQRTTISHRRWRRGPADKPQRDRSFRGTGAEYRRTRRNSARLAALRIPSVRALIALAPFPCAVLGPVE